MKQVEQVKENGEVVIDYDQPMRGKEIYEELGRLFPNEVVKDRKQYLLYGKIGALTAAITYLGHPHPIKKKRIQIKDYFPQYVLENERKNLETIYLGLYRYESTKVYVVFQVRSYIGKKAHNSSAHVHTPDLQYALLYGWKEKIDSFGNIIYLFREDKFIDYIHRTALGSGFRDYDEQIRALLDYFREFFVEIPKEWEGITCYREMMEAEDNNAKQGEWQGFYFEYLFKKWLKETKNKMVEWWSNKQDSEVDFDIKIHVNDWTYGDLKCHKGGEDILGNSFESLDKVIVEHDGTVYYIVCSYRAYLDKDNAYRVTKFWNSFRDDPYLTDEEIINGYGKRMKSKVVIKEISILKIDDMALEIIKRHPFNQGLNSNGIARQPKAKINKELIDSLSLATYQAN